MLQIFFLLLNIYVKLLLKSKMLGLVLEKKMGNQMYPKLQK